MSSVCVEAAVGLGSNLGDRHRRIQAAIEFLKSLTAHGDQEVSPLFETEPVDCPPGSPLFLNGVAVFQTILPPIDLLERLRAFEKEQGRENTHAKNVARTLDLDLLYYGDLMMESETLILPHPRMMTRLFVLEPLSALRPNLILPGQTVTVAETLEKVRRQSVKTLLPAISRAP